MSNRNVYIPRTFTRFAIVCVAAVAVLGAIRDGLDNLQGPPSAATPAEAASAAEALRLLGELHIAREGDRHGYQRNLFGDWVTQPDGCGTRERVLIEESTTPAATGQGCTVTEGQWEPWFGGHGTFADPSGLDIDHLVPLAEAWDSGAHTWTPEDRERFANDLTRPDALVAVPAGQNRAKGDQDPADWLPPDVDAWCRYSIAWVTQKHAWGLTIDQPEHDRLADVLEDCATGEAAG